MREAKQLPRIETLLFFGSFDPMTLGHAAVVDAGLLSLQPGSIHLIAAYKEGWGKKLTDFDDRAHMIGLVIREHPSWKGKVRLNDVERVQQLSGVTAHTLHCLLEGEMRGQHLGLLMGADWLLSFPTWREWEWMLSVAPAFVALRGEETLASLQSQLPQVKPYFNQSVFFLPETRTLATRQISSTQVRQAVKAGKDTGLVSPEVLGFIQTQSLYQR